MIFNLTNKNSKRKRNSIKELYMSLFEKKPVEAVLSRSANSTCKKTLTAMELIVIGVGSMVGSGIFTATCVVAANYTGPSIIFSYLIAGVISLFAAFMYAEMTSKLPTKGSLYDYCYVGFGQIFAWFVFSSLVIELIFGMSFTIVALFSYIRNLLESMNIILPNWYVNSTPTRGIVSLPSISIVALVTLALYTGTIGGKLIRRLLFTVKMLAILIFVISVCKYCNPNNMLPLLPFGTSGMLVGAGTLFICFYGFSPIVVLVDECKNPKKDMLFGLSASVALTCLVYLVTSFIIVSLKPYYTLNSITAIFDILKYYNANLGTALVYTAGIVGMLFIMLFFTEAVVKIFKSAIEDKMIPAFFNKGMLLVIISGILTCVFSQAFAFNTLIQINAIAIGLNYLVLSIVVIYFRIKHKELKSSIQTPYIGIVAPVTICFTLFLVYKSIDNISVSYNLFYLYLGFFLYYFAGILYKKYIRRSCNRT